MVCLFSISNDDSKSLYLPLYLDPDLAYIFCKYKIAAKESCKLQAERGNNSDTNENLRGRIILGQKSLQSVEQNVLAVDNVAFWPNAHSKITPEIRSALLGSCGGTLNYFPNTSAVFIKGYTFSCEF